MVNFNFLTPFACGIIFIFLGIIMFLFPPKKINNFYGYRTQLSKSSQARWDFAQLYSAKQMILLGGLLSVISAVAFLIPFTESISVSISLLLLTGMVAALVIRVEKAIRKRFGNIPGDHSQ